MHPAHEAIPYTTEVRADTGLTNPKLGIWLFLASEVMLFGSLFSAYALLRMGAPTWPDQSATLSVPLASLNTVILISSSVTMVMAWASLKRGTGIGDRGSAVPGTYRLYMGLTLLGGLLFLGVKVFEYGDKFSHHLYPSSSNFLALYFTLTGLHAIHVIAGMVVNAFLWLPGARMWRTEPERFTNRVEIAGIYWHFVDLVWIFLFPILYLL